MHCSRGYSPPRDRTPCLLRLPDWQADSLPLAPPTGMKVKRKVKVKSLSGVRFFATPPTVFCQTPPPMRFSREEYRSWLPFPSPGDLPDPGIEPWSQAPQADYHLSHQGRPLLEYTLTNEIVTFTSKKIPSSPVFLTPSPLHVIHPKAARS